MKNYPELEYNIGVVLHCSLNPISPLVYTNKVKNDLKNINL